MLKIIHRRIGNIVQYRVIWKDTEILAATFNSLKEAANFVQYKES